MPDGPPLAWLVAVLGLYAVAAPFAFGVASTTYLASLVVTGAIVTVLAAYRGMKTDEEVPLPALPAVVGILGLWLIANPYVFGEGTDSTLGLTLVVAGIVVTVIPIGMIVQVMKEKKATAA